MGPGSDPTDVCGCTASLCFAAARCFDTEDRPSRLALSEVAGDGRLGVGVLSRDAATVEVFRNNDPATLVSSSLHGVCGVGFVPRGHLELPDTTTLLELRSAELGAAGAVGARQNSTCGPGEAAPPVSYLESVCTERAGLATRSRYPVASLIACRAVHSASSGGSHIVSTKSNMPRVTSSE